MRFIRSCSPLLLSLLLFAACGGSDPVAPGSGSPSGAPTSKGTFTSIVSFGDSLSDLGTYRQATSTTGGGAEPFFGGKFTTNSGFTTATANSATSTIWVENIATTMGLTITPYEIGFGPIPVTTCPSRATATCTGYGQGGSRITDPNGIGKAGGALTIPVVTQIANHVAAHLDTVTHNAFTANDLIFLFAGANDVFTQFGAFGAKAAKANADAAAGLITPQQANDLVFQAQVAAEDEMKKAAAELSGYIKSEILAKGGKYVAVINLPDIGDTPFGNSKQVGTGKAVLSLLSTDFNAALRDGLNAQPVQIVDAYAIFKAVYANPGNYGFTNNTVPVCDATKISALTAGKVADGSSLFCSNSPGVDGTRTGSSVTTWQFADSVHPTTGAHKALSDIIYTQLKSFGWI